MPKRVGRGNKRLLWLGVSIAALAYGWWFTGLRPFSAAAHVALLIAVGLLIGLGEWQRERPAASARYEATRRAPGFRFAVVVWTAVTTAVVAWELIALRSMPRSAHPTISSLVEGSEHHHLARLALYAVWIWLGWTLAS